MSRPGPFRRALLVLLACPGIAMAAGRLEARARDGGGLTVVNGTGAAVRLQAAVGVEGLDRRGWNALPTEMNLVAACPAVEAEAPPAPVTLAPGARLSPPPWRGWSCSGQCELFCMSNAYWGTGPFRFRITTAARDATVVSAPFHMPDRPPNWRGRTRGHAPVRSLPR